MKKYLLLYQMLFLFCIAQAQQKDTIEVHKIGDKYYVIMDHQQTDSSVQAAVKAATKPRVFNEYFTVGGLATIGFGNIWSKNKQVTDGITLGNTQKLPITNSFPTSQFEFSPMLQWRHGNNLLVEFEPSLNPGSYPTLGVNWACISYFAYPGVIIRGGYLVLPFGTYNKRFAAGWINPLATDPIGVTSSPVSSDWGIEMEGGLPMGNMKVNYDIALTNGFQLMTDPSGAQGAIANPGLVDNNLGKTVSGRFGWLPLINSGLEIGISGLYGKVGNAGDTIYKNAASYMGAVDLQYIYSGRRAVLRLKGQYNIQYVTTENYANPYLATDSTKTPTYTYTNTAMGWYVTASVRPVSSSQFLRNLEFAARYSAYDNPTGSNWESHSQQITAGVCYWLNWRTVIKITYENLTASNPTNYNLGISNLKNIQNILYAQFSVQF
jgi:hypothetical protein